MNFHIMTLFPEMVETGLNTSIIGRAKEAGLISVNTVNIRDFSDDMHGSVDDYPYGGGAGMVMACQPIYDCYQSIKEKCAKDNDDGYKPHVIYMSPQGKVFTQEKARELSSYKDLVILCGHYEGVDERVIDLIVDEEVSIGDYILTGGELAAMVVVDAVSRMVPKVLSNDLSGEDETFNKMSGTEEYEQLTKRQKQNLREYETANLLEYPQYTRPREYMGMEVPEVLLSGNHAEIYKWRHETAIERTKRKRPDLLE